MLRKGETIEIQSCKQDRKIGDTIEIADFNQGGQIVNVGQVVKIIAGAGFVITLIVKILA